MILPDSQRLHGLVAATHTPFHADGSLNLDVVETQVTHFLKHGIKVAFVAGTTGESSSLTFEERKALAQRWCEVARGTELRVVVHVGSNCIADSCAFAAHAQQLGAFAVAALSPSYFKPRSMEAFIAGSAEIAAAAPDIPFYSYDIPSMTGVHLSMPEFLAKAKGRIPNLAGVKFTNPDLVAYQYCIRADEGAWDVPFGIDEHLLGGLAMGARGAIGSGYNFAGPVYNRMLAAFARGDLKEAREEQFRGVQLIQLFASYGYMGAAKAAMKMIGVDVGPARLPNETLTAAQVGELRGKLEAMGYFDWIRS